ncbi:RHS repeat-associated core domain-containing protein [Sorangium sp. So ce1000]|uniref:RHS repeat-associated core domain-containing protein n=1 Tax=Sorangium sp. So ce1000 TaxID=3133325 RepID=UPI003F631E18
MTPSRSSSAKHGFTGHEHDDELGWVDTQGRVYDPSLRRFLTSDPVIPSPLTVQGYNPYAYVLNDPLNLRDPTGFEPCDGTNCTPITPETIAPPPGVTIDSDGTGTKEVNVFEDGEEPLPEDDGAIESSGGGGAGPGGEGVKGGPPSDGDRGTEFGFSIGPMTAADMRELTHVCLDACGFAPPPVGPVCDFANACIYAGEGHTENAALSLMAATPGVGDASMLYSSVKGAGQVGKAGRMAREAGATQAARGGSRAAAAANLRRMGLQGVNLAGETYNSGRKALERAGFVLERTTDTGRRVFKNSQTGAEVFYDSGRALAPGQKPNWHIRDAGGNRYDRSGRIVASDEVAGHVPGD